MSVWGTPPVAMAIGRSRRQGPGAGFWVSVLSSGLISLFGGLVMLIVIVAQASVRTVLVGYLTVGVGPLLFPLMTGFTSGRTEAQYPTGRPLISILAALVLPLQVMAYCLGHAVGTSSIRQAQNRRTQREAKTTALTVLDEPAAPVNLLAVAQATASSAFGTPGAHVGFDLDTGRYISANPRGGCLVLGPPGSGKSSAILIPSVIVAPGACVSSSIKGDVMAATASTRARMGRVWHFDPGGDQAPGAGVLIARWSPLVSIRTWEDARRMGTRMAQTLHKSANGQGGGEGNGAHFVDRARDWLEVLMYAAVLAGKPIATVATWANTPTSTRDGGTVAQVLDALCAAEADGDRGAEVARIQLEGLMAIEDRERSSIVSTLVRMLRLYGSVVARDLGESPNFDPVEFVRSSDTLYVTASPDKQQEYAPLISSLLEEIRFAVYARHAAEEAGRERKRPHVTFVLDEANNTAPIPLPAIISEAGGQSLHIIVGIQELSRARARWGREADGFLTLFPTKVVLPGVVEPYTLDALSNAAGEFDRQMVGYSESLIYPPGNPFGMTHTSPSYSVQRTKRLHQGDIAQLPQGSALLWEGAQFWRVAVQMHWASPTWQGIERESRNWRRLGPSAPYITEASEVVTLPPEAITARSQA